MQSPLNKEQKKARLKEIIMGLHKGLSPGEAKERFESEIGNVTSSEIASLEQSLIDEGLSPDEIKKFCNVHALIFESALEKTVVKETSPSHPVYLFKLENRETEKLVEKLKLTLQRRDKYTVPDIRTKLKEWLSGISDIEKHYERKEELLFPFLEKKDFTGPSKVMWGKDNEIRDLLKAARTEVDAINSMDDLNNFVDNKLNPFVDEVTGMIFKEENILFPTSLEKLDAADWVSILRESDDIGYAFIEKPAETSELLKHLQESIAEGAAVRDDSIELPTGTINICDLVPILNTLPVDLTFVDSDDVVRYFSGSKDRIFLRTRAVLGRKVQNCHPPQSVDVVEKILTSFKNGEKDSYDFWIKLKEKLVYIRYFAVRDSQGNYLGTLEVTQDISGIKQLEGERRLLDERA